MESTKQAVGLEEVLKRLLKTYPAFYKPVVEEATHWLFENGDIGWTLLFGSLTDVLREKMDEYEFDDFEKVFDLLEEFATCGNESIEAGVLTGFMEAMFNYSATYDPKFLACLLGPESRAYLIEWEKFCGQDPSWLYEKK